MLHLIFSTQLIELFADPGLFGIDIDTDARFKPVSEFDADALHHLVNRHFRRERARFWGLAT